jgi:hypothetical protein
MIVQIHKECQECQGAEEQIYAHTVANRKYPFNLNHAEHIVETFTAHVQPCAHTRH